MATHVSAGRRPTTSGLENTGTIVLCLFAGALQISVAASEWLLTVALGLWVWLLVAHREPFSPPSFFWPLAVYAGLTLVSVAGSLDPLASLFDAKEIVLFLVVPLAHRLARGRAGVVATVIVSVGAATAAYGIVQYGILEFDTLGRRPQGSMGHYMTYSGLIMLVLCLATARVVFGGAERIWAGLVLPALVAALAVTLTRSAWIGSCAGVGLLVALKDRRLLAAVPVIAALLLMLAPASVTDRFYSTFDLQNPTNRDRFAMARAGLRMIADHPMTGVGPDMVQRVYPEYRDAGSVNETNPHLHNVPLQIAAERGLPALTAWLWFVVVATRTLLRSLRLKETRALAAGGLAAMAAMLTAGMFEYNFGDSEFLMLFLVLITLPGVGADVASSRASVAEQCPACP